MKILITGAAGFIGSALTIKLLNLHTNIKIVGIDNFNDCYDTQLKWDRINRYSNDPRFTLYIADISHADDIHTIFNNEQPNYVINLASQYDVTDMVADIGYTTSNTIEQCIEEFTKWYLEYYK